MMKYVTALILMAFAAFAVFGVFSLHAGADGHTGSCAAAVLQGGDCPAQLSPLARLDFHLDSFAKLASAIAAAFFSALSILFVSAVAGLLVVPRPPALAYARARHFETFAAHPKKKTLRWLSLHEQSPSSR